MNESGAGVKPVAMDTGRFSRPGLRRVAIAGLATYVPPRILSNHDLEKMVETSDEWIQQRTGIRERHIVDPGVATSDLAKEAALKASGRGDLETLERGRWLDCAKRSTRRRPRLTWDKPVSRLG